jgi:hypothetical protein
MDGSAEFRAAAGPPKPGFRLDRSASREGRPQVIARVARIVVIADFVFPATGVVAQPVTGVWSPSRSAISLTKAGSCCRSRFIW